MPSFTINGLKGVPFLRWRADGFMLRFQLGLKISHQGLPLCRVERDPSPLKSEYFFVSRW